MNSNNWLALFILSALGVAGYLILTKPDPEDDGWGDLGPDWWDL